ncbi:MAG: FAD binding domain-containing protein [Minwuia sp.]|nr:FAD binding domain-containing protein [Minwuia sp.]
MIDPVPRSRRRIVPFRVHRPTTVQEAVATHAGLPNAAYMGGGIDLLNGMKTGIEWDEVILLRDIAALRTVQAIDGDVRMGSGISLDALGCHPVLREAMPSVAEAFAPIANVRIRHQGTLGGNLMARKPHYDLLPVLMAVGATVTFATRDGVVDLPAVWLGSSTKPSAFGALLTDVQIPTAARVLIHDRSHLPGFLLTVGHSGDGNWRAVVAGAHPLPQVRTLDLPAGTELPLDPDAAREVAAAFSARLPIMSDRANISGAWRHRAVPVVLSRLLADVADMHRTDAA